MQLSYLSYCHQIVIFIISNKQIKTIKNILNKTNAILIAILHYFFKQKSKNKYVQLV